MEHVWSQAKHADLCGWAAPDVLALEERVQASLDGQRIEQALLKAHFRWAGLDLK